jgi:hypothetical protein
MTDTITVNAADVRAISRGRYVCPSCGAKGCGYANFSRSAGWSGDFRVRCRYCRAEAKVRHKEPSR